MSFPILLSPPSQVQTLNADLTPAPWSLLLRNTNLHPLNLGAHNWNIHHVDEGLFLRLVIHPLYSGFVKVLNFCSFLTTESSK